MAAADLRKSRTPISEFDLPMKDICLMLARLWILADFCQAVEMHGDSHGQSEGPNSQYQKGTEQVLVEVLVDVEVMATAVVVV
jgi:hypothetical protein